MTKKPIKSERRKKQRKDERKRKLTKNGEKMRKKRKNAERRRKKRRKAKEDGKPDKGRTNTNKDEHFYEFSADFLHSFWL